MLAFTSSAPVCAAAALAHPTPRIIDSLTRWSSALDHLGIDRTLDDGRAITAELAALAYDRDIDYITQRLEADSTNGLLRLPAEDRQLLFSEVADSVSPEMYIQIRNETNAINESIGVARPVRLAVLDGDDIQINENFYTARFRGQGWWRALSFGKPAGERERPYQVFYPGREPERISGDIDSVASIRSLHPQLLQPPTHRMAQWTLPGARLAHLNSHENRFPFDADTVMRFGGLSVMGISATDIPDHIDQKQAARLVDVLVVSGRMDVHSFEPLHTLLDQVQPRVAFVSFNADANFLRHHKTKILPVADIDREYGDIFFNPHSEELRASVRDANTHEVLRSVTSNTDKAGRIQQILHDERRTYIDEIAAQLEQTYGPQDTLVIRAGLAVNDVLDHVAGFLLAAERNPYPTFLESIDELNAVQTGYQQLLTGLTFDKETVDDMTQQGIEAFAHILGAWGMRGY